MSEPEESKKEESRGDMDSALQALLGDLNAESLDAPEVEGSAAEAAAEELTTPQPTPSEPVEFVVEPEQAPTPKPTRTESQIPTELPPLPLSENPDSPFKNVEEEYPLSAVSESAPGPRPRFQPSPTKKKKRWPIVILLLLIFTAAAGFGYLYWQKHQALNTPEKLAELPPELELPPMDAAFLPQESASSPDSMNEQNTPSTQNHAPVSTAPSTNDPPKSDLSHPASTTQIHAKPTPAPILSHEPNMPRAMDSTILQGLNGTLKGKSVRFRCDIALFSSQSGLRAKLSPYEEAIRVVATNIFYFTVPGKAILPDIEQQVLQKAGFLFPDGRLIRVEVRNLELEPVKR
jgi:hypothetical protein